MKKEVKTLLKSIQDDKDKGLIISISNHSKMVSLWLKLYGSGGYYYPYLTDNDMINDLKQYIK